MRNQFVYTEEIMVPSKEETSAESEKITVRHSFNINMVTKIIQVDTDGSVIVFLDDMHERYENKPSKGRNGKMSIKREKDNFQSEIKLNKENADRLFALTDISKK